MITAQEMREFAGYLRNVTDAQVQGVFDKEHGAGREEYAELARMEALRRGFILDEQTETEERENTYREVYVPVAIRFHRDGTREAEVDFEGAPWPHVDKGGNVWVDSTEDWETDEDLEVQAISMLANFLEGFGK